MVKYGNFHVYPSKPSTFFKEKKVEKQVFHVFDRETLLEIKKFIVQKWAPSENGPRQSISKSEKANLDFSHYITWLSRDHVTIMWNFARN